MPWSDYLKDELGDHVWGAKSYTAPATLYFARYTVAPTGAGGGTEVGSRVAVTNNSTNFPASASQVIRNANDIDWGTAGSDLGTIVAIGVFDADPGGNLLAYTTITARTVNTGDPFLISANSAEFKYLSF